MPEKSGPGGAVARLLVLGVVFHVVYSWSIFDIYFRSPLVHGMTPVSSPRPAPAKRLLLAVADGLRADKLFENCLARAPYLRDVVLNHGTWGVSHTRVPTESRPGHVALIAGFYEDVSAVTKGWKVNPVTFDSVFNESTHTWSFGSPDILPMFAEGASDRIKVDTFMYPPESEDFAEDASRLDTWVFNKFDELLESAKRNDTLNEMMRQDGVVFFLHLLGLDTNGHAYRPYSPEYLNNIKVVDAGIEDVVRKLNQFYDNDGRTAFVFTADHGMSNRGNHGDGHPDNTQTPLVAWGAGITGPNYTHPTGHDELSALWNLGDLRRVDVEQADVAPLMSTLIGIPYPMNSVGVLPLEYLSASDHEKALAAFGNAKEVLAQYLVKAEAKRRTELFFKPFKPLKRHSELVGAIQQLIDEEQIQEAIKLSKQLMQLSLEGLRYYQTYDWLLLRSIISAGYLGWIVYSTLCILTSGIVPASGTESLRSSGEGASQGRLIDIIGCMTFLAFVGLLYYQHSPAIYYAYVAFPVFFWASSLKQRPLIASLINGRQVGSRDGAKALLAIIAYVAGLEILVYSFFRREILTPCLWIIGLLWPQTLSRPFRAQHSTLIRLWMLSCLATSIFPILPVEKGEDLLLVVLGGVLILVSGIYAMVQLPRFAASVLPRSTGSRRRDRLTIVLVELAIISISVIITADTTLRLRSKSGLPLVNQVISWCILIMSIAIPILDGIFRGQYYLRRLIVIYLAFAPVFILLTISYEALFYFCFSCTILLWLLLERETYGESKHQPHTEEYSEATSAIRVAHRSLDIRDLRVGGFFLLFINVAFFGTGNIASVSSFSLESVYRFTTVFNPFLMGALLILKILIPFFLLSSVFAVVGRALELPPFSLFLLILSTTDIMTLNFFFLVRDSGSWLEIGTTISHFVIASAFIVFQIILFVVSYVLVGTVLVPDIVNKTKKRR